MLRALFGPNTTTSTLRRGLNESMEAHRAIARRIAGAVTSSSQASTETASGGASPSGAEDLVGEMASLADEQLRYETEARLLKMVYDRIRSSING